MPDLNSILHSPQAEKLLDNSTRLERLKDAPETQKIFALLTRSANGDLEQAAEKAAKGDSAQLMAAVRQLMQDPEAVRLVEQIKQNLK